MNTKISKEKATELAKAAGLEVTTERTLTDGTKLVFVGLATISHDGKGGKACWRVSLHNTVDSHRYYIGQAIEKATRMIVEEKASKDRAVEALKATIQSLPSGAGAAVEFDPTYDPSSDEALVEYAAAMGDSVVLDSYEAIAEFNDGASEVQVVPEDVQPAAEAVVGQDGAFEASLIGELDEAEAAIKAARRKEQRKTYRKTRQAKLKVARAVSLTNLQKEVLRKVDLYYKYAKGESRLCNGVGEYLEDIASCAQVAADFVDNGMTIFAVTGVLSSLVEKGVLFTDSVNDEHVVYYVTEQWFDRVGELVRAELMVSVA